jgi:hypothetical protein
MMMQQLFYFLNHGGGATLVNTELVNRETLSPRSGSERAVCRCVHRQDLRTLIW